jgi:penicillin-binding protein 1A
LIVVVAILLVLSAAGGATLGYFMKLDLPDVRALEDYAPPLMTRVLARDGTPVATFAQERRILIDYPEIPESFRNALIATEDVRFYEHTGVDFRGIVRAAWHDLIHLRLDQGASTLTQQLARGLFLNRRKIWRRKLQEMVLALEIERNYSKEEIVKFYSNQVYMGHGLYGLEAAARYYFGKHARDLELSESAVLAGLIQRPEGLSPRRHPDRALQRRNHVLTRMAESRLLTPAKADEAMRTEIVLAEHQGLENPAPYFVEGVRRWLQSKLGENSVYQAGLEVRTTVDLRLQEIANRAVDRGLRQMDKGQGWRGPAGQVPENEDPATWEPESWKKDPVVGEVVEGVVLSADADGATVRVGPYTGVLTQKAIGWTKEKKPGALVSAGDIVHVRIGAIDEEGTASLSLEQEPAVEGALVAIEPRTGSVLALVGGFSFERSEFDRSTQARRQTGSAFKPFVYAAALAEGWVPTHRILDEPLVLLDTRTLEPYQPENFTDEYYGNLTLRRALEKSANIGTVKLLNELGYEPVIEMSRRLGISARLYPYPSLALGAFEVSLMELTSAYGTFANQGVRVEPHMIYEVLDREGSVIERITPAVTDAVSPQVAFLMNRLLEGVITDGTGRSARGLGRPLAGKTGTTDDNTDAWFIGYTPELVLGVWVGFDVKTSLGKRETGALAALPVWKAFIEEAYADIPPIEFPRPPGIVEVAIHRDTGLRANPAAACRPVFAESFLAGTEPTRFCSAAEHKRMKLPYPFQQFPLTERGELAAPWNVLLQLTEGEPKTRLSSDGRRLEAKGEDGVVIVPVQLLPSIPHAELPAWVVDALETKARQLRDAAVEAEEEGDEERLAELDEPEKFFPEMWLGQDGRHPRIVLLR